MIEKLVKGLNISESVLRQEYELVPSPLFTSPFLTSTPNTAKVQQYV